MAKTRKISMKRRAKQTRRRQHGGIFESFFGRRYAKVAPEPPPNKPTANTARRLHNPHGPHEYADDFAYLKAIREGKAKRNPRYR
jgi:hypothetical protein